MQVSIKYFLIVLVTAIAANMFAGYAGLNYLWTLLMGMGLPALVAWFMGRKSLTTNDWKPFLCFEAFAIVSSTIIEVVMLYFDTWGFTKSHGRFIGVNFLGAPIEEYIYWWMAPVLVGIIYITLRKVNKIEEFPPIIEAAIAWIATKSSTAMNASTSADASPYLEDDGVTVKNGNYKRGETKFPTWIWIQVLIVGLLIYLKQYFKGNWLTVLQTSLIFACVAFIGERHAIDYGFWAYNTQRVVGIFILNIPIEEYPMYFLSAIVECVIIDIVGRKYFNMR